MRGLRSVLVRFVTAILVPGVQEVLFEALKSSEFNDHHHRSGRDGDDCAADQAARLRRRASASVHAAGLPATWSSGSIGTVHPALPGGALARASASTRPAPS